MPTSMIMARAVIRNEQLDDHLGSIVDFAADLDFRKSPEFESHGDFPLMVARGLSRERASELAERLRDSGLETFVIADSPFAFLLRWSGCRADVVARTGLRLVYAALLAFVLVSIMGADRKLANLALAGLIFVFLECLGFVRWRRPALLRDMR